MMVRTQMHLKSIYSAIKYIKQLLLLPFQSIKHTVESTPGKVPSSIQLGFFMKLNFYAALLSSAGDL
jgi:hypothetical protein